MKRFSFFLVILLFAVILGCGDGGGDAYTNAADGMTPDSNGGGGMAQEGIWLTNGSAIIQSGASASFAFSIPQAGGIGGLVSRNDNADFTGQVTIYFIIDGQEMGVVQSSGSEDYLSSAIAVTDAGAGYLVVVNGQPTPLDMRYIVVFETGS